MLDRDSRHAPSLRREMTNRRAAILLLLAAGGCVPIPYTARISPPMTGVYRRADGTPVAGVPVFVTGGELTCGGALARTTTDSLGLFRLPVARRRQGWFPLNADLAWYPYTVCTGAGDSLRAVYRGRGWERREIAIGCLEADRRVECDPSRGIDVRSGGRWKDGARRGWFRLVAVSLGVDEPRDRVIVQWMARSPVRGHDAEEVARAELPCGAGECRLDPRGISSADAVSYASILAYGGAGTRERRFELGPPGQVREIGPESRR